MSEWTETARRALEQYCARAREALAGTGADANEVVEDLRRHVEEEARVAKLSVVTEEDVRRILTRVGEPGSVIAAQPNRDQPPPAAATTPKEKIRPGYILLMLGVVLPLITLGFELATGMSAGVLFDPLPSWMHVVAVGMVPLANFWIWRAGRKQDGRRATLLGWLNGAALGVSAWYAVLYLPFIPFAAIGVIWFGLGLIPLGPYFALLATPWLRAKYAKRIGRERLPGALAGAGVALGFLIIFQLPTALTYYGLAKATSDTLESRKHGVRVLRTFGDRELLLRACYGLMRRELDFDLVREVAGGNKEVTADQAREIYYRVTGKPFNATPPPSLFTRAGRWNALDDELTWDEGLGGEAIAGRVKGLSLLSSRLDAVAEPDAALVYCEWTMEFKNISRQQREARAQIALPPGAVVSRLTLWVNGEEREAAFGGRAQVRKAYQEVAVVQRRDPVLVTTCGPDRVLMQCFPVPASGGTMKVRMGITAPLVLESAERGRFLWPRFLERNFSVSGEFKHALWVESPMPLSATATNAIAAHSVTNQFALRQTLSEAELADAPANVVVQRARQIETVSTPANADGRAIRQTIRATAARKPKRIVLVLDGSAGVRSYIGEMSEALAGLSEDVEITALVADEETSRVLIKPQKATPAALEELRQQIRKSRFAGGHDNLPVLTEAWDLASAVENGVVIWIHAPQPVLLSNGDALQQRFDRAAVPPRFYELQVGVGPDRVAEKLDGSTVEHVARLGALQADLGDLLTQLSGNAARLTFVREQIEAVTGIGAEKTASKHVERLWARDEVYRLAKARQREAATRLAAAEQLVTPVTGAVVLETMQQFAQHGLTPADPNTVPAVPEPQTGLLMLMGLLLFGFRRWVRRKAVG